MTQLKPLDFHCAPRLHRDVNCVTVGVVPHRSQRNGRFHGRDGWRVSLWAKASRYANHEAVFAVNEPDRVATQFRRS